MKIGIYGSGAIGCFLGGILAASGCDVTFLCRPKVYNILSEKGLIISDLYGFLEKIESSALQLTTDISEMSKMDVVFICVKSASTEEVAYEIKKEFISHRPILISFQNGVSNVPMLKDILKEYQILEGMVPYNISMQSEMHFHRGTEGQLIVKSSELNQGLIEEFKKANLDIQFSDAMLEIQWAKLLLNLNNSINAISGLPLKQQLSIREYRQCLAMANKEALNLLKIYQIKPAKLTVISPDIIPYILSLPNSLFKIISHKTLKIDPLARSSMQDDLLSGKPTEVDWINGEIIKLANKIGKEAPINEYLLKCIKQKEKSNSIDVILAKDLKSQLSKLVNK